MKTVWEMEDIHALDAACAHARFQIDEFSRFEAFERKPDNRAEKERLAFGTVGSSRAKPTDEEIDALFRYRREFARVQASCALRGLKERFGITLSCDAPPEAK